MQINIYVFLISYSFSTKLVNRSIIPMKTRVNTCIFEAKTDPYCFSNTSIMKPVGLNS